MDYTNVVQLLRSDPNAGVLAVAEQFGDALYDYSYALLGDHGEAANALHDVLLVASARVRQLRRPVDLERWLYALVRNEAHRRQRAGTRPAATIASRQERWRPVNELDPNVMALDVQAPGVLDLVLRHGLGPAELSAVLGVSVGRAQELVTRARALADNSSAASPYFTMPATVPERVIETLADPARVAFAVELAGGFDRAGFPVPRRQGRRRLLVMAAGVAVLTLATGAGIAFTDDPNREDRRSAIGEPAVPGSDPESPSAEPALATPSAVPTGSSSSSPSATPTATPTLSPAKSPPPSSSTQPVPGPAPSKTVAPLDVTITVAKRGKDCGQRWKATVVAKASAGTAQQITIFWWWPGESPHSRSGTPGSGGRFRADVSELPYDTVVSFRATAVTADGRRGESDTATQKWPSCKDNDDD